MEIWPSTKYTKILIFLHSPSADCCICIFLLLLLVQLLTILPTQKSNQICLTSCIVKYQNIISYSCDFIDFYHNSPLLFLFQSECPGLFIFAWWGRHSVGDCLYDNFPYHFSSWQGQNAYCSQDINSLLDLCTGNIPLLINWWSFLFFFFPISNF